MPESIVPVSPEDIDAVCRIERQLFPMPWSRESFLQIAADPTFLFLVAKSAGRTTHDAARIVGYLVCQLFPPEAELHNIAVAPHMQHKGVGRKMLHALVDRLCLCRIKKIYLLVRDSNRSAIRFYQKQGFAQVGMRPRYYESKENAWIMAIDI